jgi:hypothetical protein
VFVDGVKVKTLRGENIAQEFQAIVDEYVRSHYGPGAKQAHKKRWPDRCAMAQGSGITEQQQT